MSLDALFKRANAAMTAGRWAEAERAYRGLTRLKPSWANHNLGVLLTATGRLAEAELAYRAALAAEPGLADSEHSLAMLLLALGRYAEGWPLYEARRRIGGLNIPAPRLPYPEWRGEDLTGKRLLVVKEQGLGDQIMLARFVPELERRGAQVAYLCDPSLERLLRANGIDARGLPAGSSYPSADYWVLAYSVPLRLGLTLETVTGQPYLAAQPWAAAGGVGVKVRGSPTHRNDRNRSLSPAAARQLEALGSDLDPAATGAADFQETAQIIAGLDLVVTVDTSVAHLAGAMGKPVWILLSAVETDWRWLRDRSDSPWYASARLFRQTTIGQWGDVLEAVKQALAERPVKAPQAIPPPA